MQPTIRSIPVLLICASIAALAASPPVIGVARSRGSLLIDSASVPGSATIFNGSSLQTLGSPSDVRLRSGEALTLAPSSAATIYDQRIVLRDGLVEANHLTRSPIDAGDLLIAASGADGRFRVAIDKNRQVRVSALSGTAEVRNSTGMLVARVFPGTALQLQAARGAAVARCVLTGVLTTRAGRFFLDDETTKIDVELRGASLHSLVGKRVRVTGSVDTGQKPSRPASEVVDVATATESASGPAGSSGPAAGAAVSAGISTKAIAAIGATALGGAFGGMAAAGVFSSSEPSVSR